MLTITGAEVVQKFPRPGGNITVKFTVKNIGDQTAPGQTSLGVEMYSANKNGARISGDFVKAIPWYTNNINSLSPDQSQTISATARLDREGRHTALAVIISEGYSQQQLRIVNGTFKKSFSVVNPADLVLERVGLNHQGRLILRMYNAGAAIPDEHFQTSGISVKVASGTYKMPLRDAAPKLLQLAAKPGFLSVGRRFNYRWAATGTSGVVLSPTLQHKVEVILDYNRSIYDTRRANNTRTVWVGGKPDLVVCFKKFNHNRAHRTAIYPPVVKNIGYARSGRSKLRFWIKDDGVKTYSIPPLDPGEEYRGVQRKVYWVRVKRHRFQLTVDKNGEVDELIEGNNIIQGLIIVGKYGIMSPIRCSDAPGMTGWK